MASIINLPKKRKYHLLLSSSSASSSASSTSSSSASASLSELNNVQSKPDERVNRDDLEKDNDDYQNRKEKYNLDVNKSREEYKMKTQQALERVNQLKQENEILEKKIIVLIKEFHFLKDLFSETNKKKK